MLIIAKFTKGWYNSFVISYSQIFNTVASKLYYFYIKELIPLNDKKESVMYKILKFFVKLFYIKYDIIGLDNLPDTPAVLVGNHCQLHAPIASEVRLPFKRYTWCAGEMMHRKEVAEYAYRDFWSQKPRRVRWIYKIVSHLIVPLALCLFNNARTIPVYHDARCLTAFRQSVKRLEEGNHLVIFPECDQKYNNIIYNFQDKFIDISKVYYRRSGKALPFVPVYFAPDIKKIYIGKPTVFNPECPINEERARICGYLMEQITDLAVAAPLHRVVPYRNIGKKNYPANIPLEVYTNEEICS